MHYTRQQYMDGECDHHAYYSQFVTPDIARRVKNSIGVARIKRCYDPHFNTIPLVMWDHIGMQIKHEVEHALKQAGDVLSLAGLVCICKAAARGIKEAV